MTKSEVEEERLGEWVMPQGCEMSFMAWWKQLSSDSTVNVWYLHHCHGNSGKVSHAAKKEAKSDFLTFIDINSQPNGWSADSTLATHFFLPKFRTVQMPKKGVPNYEERVQQSIVGVFNQAQTEKQRETISDYSTSTWLKCERPKHSTYPQKSWLLQLLCQKEELLRNQTTLNHIR